MLDAKSAGMSRAETKPLLVFATAFAGPIAFLIEMFVLSITGSGWFGEVQSLCRPFATPLAWALVPVAAALSWLAVIWKRRRVLERRAKMSAHSEESTVRLETEAFLLAASAAQLPAIFATLAHLAGAYAIPCALAITISSLGVWMIARPTRGAQVPVQGGGGTGGTSMSSEPTGSSSAGGL